MTRTVDQTIRIFGLGCDIYCVWSVTPTIPPTQAQTQTHPRTPPRTSEKKSDRWVYWKDPLRRPKHTKALSVWRLDLEGNYNQRKTEQRKEGHLWCLSYFLSCGTWCVMSEHRVFWIIFHLINEHPPPPPPQSTTSTPLLKAPHLFPVSYLCPQVVENDNCISLTTVSV